MDDTPSLERSAGRPGPIAAVRAALLRASATNVAAAATGGVAAAIYLRTLAPGVSFGDWADMQALATRLGVPHPTGYPLYMLLAWLFTFVPLGDVAYRIVLLSALAAAASVGVAVLIAARLGVRPLIAAGLGLVLALSGTLWEEATFSEMNSLHLLLSALVVHRALVWRDERRDRDLLLGGLLAGLAVANHLLAATVVPIVVLFVLFDARDRLVQRPALLAWSAGLALAGVSLYLLIPLRALFGPPAQYAGLLTWDGFSSLVTGAQFRQDMHFASGESLSRAWRIVPDVVRQVELASHVVLVPGALLGAVVLFARDRWAAALLVSLAAANVYVYAGYRGDLPHYLLVTWLVLVVGFAVAAEAVVRQLVARTGGRLVGIEALVLLLPLVIGAANWDARDQSRYDVGERFSEAVFAALPRDAVLVTYWDTLTNLAYAHCVEGVRPDVAIRAFDATARQACEGDVPEIDDALARGRPVFALFATQGSLDALRASYRLVPGPVFGLPYGDRFPQFSRPLYRLEPRGGQG